jgi:hypothetical protein
VAVERREEVLHGGWLRGGRRRGLGFGRHRDVVRSGWRRRDEGGFCEEKPGGSLGAFG